MYARNYNAHRYGIILLQLTEKPRKFIKTADTCFDHIFTERIKLPM